MPSTNLRISTRLLIPPKNPVLLREDTMEPAPLARRRTLTKGTKDMALQVSLSSRQKTDLSVPMLRDIERNFENALDKLENLDQAVDPPKEPGPVEGDGHHEGGPPDKRADADQA